MKVLFRILQNQTSEELIDYVISYVIDRYSNTQKIAIVADTDIAKAIDEKLWKEGEKTFIPHFCAISTVDYNKYPKVPVFITDNMFVADGRDEVINLTNIPVNIVRHKYKSITEIVNQEPQRLTSSRKKYVYYKKLNAEVVHEKV